VKLRHTEPKKPKFDMLIGNVMKPFSKEEFLSRCQKSMIDYQNGNHQSQEDFEEESETWCPSSNPAISGC